MAAEANEERFQFPSSLPSGSELPGRVHLVVPKVDVEHNNASAHEGIAISDGLDMVEQNTDSAVLQTEGQDSFKTFQPHFLLNRLDDIKEISGGALRDIINTCSSEDTKKRHSLSADEDNLNYMEVVCEFYKAVVDGSLDVVEEIVLTYNIDINIVFNGTMPFVTRKHCGWNALHVAAAYGNVKTMQFLLAQGCDIEAVTREGETALHIAAKHGTSDVVSLLLERNVFLRDRQNSQGVTALLKAIFNSQYTFKENYRRCVDLLLGAGCNPNISSSSKVTALHLAVDKGDFKIVEKLLCSHANVNAVCDHNTTPLTRAVVAKFISMNIITALLLAGADTCWKMNGRSTLHIAVSRCDENVIETFLKSGADPNCEDVSGKTPLWIAVEENNIKVVPILVQGGGNVNYVRLPQCVSLLCQAIRNNSFDMVKLLLDLGASTYTETFMWSTPLHFAVDQQNISIIKELLRVNCSLNTTSNAKYSLRPMTPMQIAMDLGNVEIICLLLQAGCKVKTSWLREDRLSHALASKPDAVRHLQKYVSEVPSLLHLSCLSIREYLRDHFRTAVEVLKQTGVIPHKIADYISLAHVLD
ncbi:unnamed protein product [Candidula unifasciata]|uniref:Uncharacterized protein n=1 Tax=Candidula unifasciata TaxID=100452 RepID=A0A8S4A7R8_9EUPU|nr:unnamed protein product [Candidula unifasciata]